MEIWSEGCGVQVIWPRTQEEAGGDLETKKMSCRDYEPLSPQFGVTLVTIASIDRIAQLVSIGARWDGPISVALHANDDDEANEIRFLIDGRLGSWFASRDHAVRVVLVSACFADASHTEQYTFPVNVLRHHAVLCAQTETVFYVDVDFIPSHDLAKHIQVAMKEIDQESEVLVVPCFTQSDQAHASWPAAASLSLDNNASLLVSAEAVSNFDVLQAVMNGDLSVPGDNHGATEYRKWLQLTSDNHTLIADKNRTYEVSYR